jgi:transketolase
MAILRTLPEMTVVAPGDSLELRAALRQALRHDGPVYMRIGKKGEPNMHAGEPDLRLGKSITLMTGTDVCLVATGVMLFVVVEAAKILAAKGISARVESFPTVKPLDTGMLSEIFSRYPVVAVAEEHSRIGGLGGAIAEWLAAQESPRARLIAFGTDDAFMHEIGSTQYARNKFGLTADNIAAQVQARLSARRAA